MRAVSCIGGETQIERVLAHAIAESKKQRVDALVFVGDAMEENADRLCGLAGELGLLGTPVFVFHEGGDAVAGRAFRQIAQLSHGAYLSFDTASADRLKELLAAVAVYAAGGYRALADYGAKKGGEIRAADRSTAELTCLRCSAAWRSSAGCCCSSIYSSTPNPAKLARGLKWTAIIAAVLLSLSAVFRALRLSVAAADPGVSLSAAGALAVRRVPQRRNRRRGPPACRRLSADDPRSRNRGDDRHGAGRQFRRHAARGVSEAELLDLLRECRAADEEGARLVEAYLDRATPDGAATSPPGRAGPAARRQRRHERRGSL